MRKNYEEKKEEIREQAKQWQEDFSNTISYWSDLLSAYEYFTKMGKRYGLINEFRENGII